MRHFELKSRVGNLKTNKVGAIASEMFKANSGDFNGYLILTDSYGYEVWDDSSTIPLPPVLTAPVPPIVI
jgi:hypothetical protein